jgi:hypothetical protein
MNELPERRDTEAVGDDPEAILLTDAAAALAETTGLHTEVVPGATDAGTGARVDGWLRITHGTEIREYPLEAKRQLAPAGIGPVVEQLRHLGKHAILVARYVTPPMAERLCRLRTPFIDTVGNAYLDDPPFYVFVTGRRPKEPLQTPKADRLFRAAGLKVLFALLCQPQLEKAPMRDVAGIAGVGLGTLKYIYDDLRRRGNLHDKKDQRRLIGRQTLIQRWAEGYARELRPKYLVGRYAAPDLYWWKNIDVRKLEAQWGGDIAAERLTNGYIKPGTATLYTKAPPAKLVTALALKKDEAGTVEILRRFWRFDPDQREPTVPPLLVYADLVATADERGLEAAEIIRDQYLG